VDAMESITACRMVTSVVVVRKAKVVSLVQKKLSALAWVKTKISCVHAFGMKILVPIAMVAKTNYFSL
jgi:hypothetical protein